MVFKNEKLNLERLDRKWKRKGIAHILEECP